MNAWLAGLVGAVIGAIAVAVVFLLKRAASQMEMANAKARAEMLDQQLTGRGAEIEQIRRELGETSRSREAAERQAAVLSTELAKDREKLIEHKRLLEEAEKKLTAVFDSLGAKALAAN